MVELLGEKEAVERMLEDAEIYGYGNFIAHLKAAWRDKLMKEHGFSEEAAIKCADVTAYPIQK